MRRATPGSGDIAYAVRADIGGLRFLEQDQKAALAQVLQRNDLEVHPAGLAAAPDGAHTMFSIRSRQSRS